MSEEKVNHNHFMAIKHTSDKFNGVFPYAVYHREHAHEVTLHMSAMGVSRRKKVLDDEDFL